MQRRIKGERTKTVTREVLGFEIRAWSVVEILPVTIIKSD